MALSARGDRSNEYALADLISRYARADLVYQAHWLVPEHESALHGIFAAHDVKIGAADSGQRHTNHHFTETRLWNRDALQANVVGSMKHQRPHREQIEHCVRRRMVE